MSLERNSVRPFDEDEYDADMTHGFGDFRGPRAAPGDAELGPGVYEGCIIPEHGDDETGAGDDGQKKDDVGQLDEERSGVSAVDDCDIPCRVSYYTVDTDFFNTDVYDTQTLTEFTEVWYRNTIFYLYDWHMLPSFLTNDN